MNKDKLIIKIQNSKPIELTDLDFISKFIIK